jgi:hypothetical protein
MAWAVLAKNEPYRPPVLADVAAAQRLPEQDAAIATLSVQRVERVENPD